MRLPLLIAALALTAQADTLFTYTGNPFTQRSGEPYTLQDLVSISLVLDQPLGIYAPLSFFSPASWSISDGVQTITEAPYAFFQFGTDARGNINQWYVDVVSASRNLEISSYGDLRLWFLPGGMDYSGSLFPFAEHAANHADPGVWVDPPLPTPEPASILLLIPAAAALILRKPSHIRLPWRRN